MKKNHIISAAIALLLVATSCKQSLYQIYTVESDDVRTNELYMTQSNSEIELNYYLWAKYGNPGFIVTNNTDKIAYVDLSKSFFTINGLSKDYYLNREWSTTNSVGASVSATLYGYLYHYTEKYKGSVTASAYGSQSKGVFQKEKDVIAIPPHSSKIVAEYNIVSSAVSNCTLNTITGKEAAQTFTKEQTPISFSNYITYRIDNGAEQTIESNFWVSKIENVSSQKEVKREKSNYCGDKYVKVETTQLRDEKPNKFYITISSPQKSYY